MSRTLIDESLVTETVRLDFDRPSATIQLEHAIRPQSLEVWVNGLRVARNMLEYDGASRTVTVPWVLFAGDTVTVRAAKLKA